MSKKLNRRSFLKRAATAAAAPWLVVNQLADATEMVISGQIGASWWDDSGNTEKEFRDKFNQVPQGRKIHVRINSEGGSVSDALGIYNMLQSRKDDVTTFNDGYALSSGSLILAGGGRVITPHSSLTMIHEPWSMTVGNEADHLRAAEMLDKHGETIASIYSKLTGKTVDDCRALMRDETWMTGEEAVEEGFADAMTVDSACPNCGALQDGDEVVEGGNITCEQCGQTHTVEEWEEGEAEEEGDEEVENRKRFFSALDLSKYKRIPNHIFNLVTKGILAPLARKKSSAVSGSAAGNNKPPMPQNVGQQPSNDKMNKAAVIALLRKRGIEIADDASEEQVQAALEKLGEATPSTAAAPAGAAAQPGSTATGTALSAADNQMIVDLRKQLSAEKRARVTAEVTKRSENKIQNKNLAWWIELAMNEGQEQAVYAQIDALPVDMPGGAPISSTGIRVTENRLEEIKKSHPGARNAAKRYAMVKEEWDGLIADALVRDSRMATRGPVQNANTYSASLVTQFLLDGAVTKLQNRWAPLRVFSRDYSTDRFKPRATGQLKFVTSGATTQTNPSNFESGDSVVSNTQIAVSQYNQPFHVSNDELNSGLRMENLVEANISALADKVLAVAFTPVTKAGFITNAPLIRGAGAFNFSDMATAWGQLKKAPIKFAVLDGEYMARIINNPVFYQATGTQSGEGDGWARFGWDGVFLNTNWTGTPPADNIRGLFLNPQLLGAIAGLPLTPPTIPGNTLAQSTITIPDVDISIETYSWFSLSTRTFWMSYDLMFGSSLLDESAGVALCSA